MHRSPLSNSMHPSVNTFIDDIPEPADQGHANGIVLLADALYRSGLSIIDDSSADIEQGFIDLMLEGDTLARREPYNTDLNALVSEILGICAGNGLGCHVRLAVHVRFDVKEEDQ